MLVQCIQCKYPAYFSTTAIQRGDSAQCKRCGTQFRTDATARAILCEASSPAEAPRQQEASEPVDVPAAVDPRCPRIEIPPGCGRISLDFVFADPEGNVQLCRTSRLDRSFLLFHVTVPLPEGLSTGAFRIQGEEAEVHLEVDPGFWGTQGPVPAKYFPTDFNSGLLISALVDIAGGHGGWLVACPVCADCQPVSEGILHGQVALSSCPCGTTSLVGPDGVILDLTACPTCGSTDGLAVARANGPDHPAPCPNCGTPLAVDMYGRLIAGASAPSGEPESAPRQVPGCPVCNRTSEVIYLLSSEGEVQTPCLGCGTLLGLVDGRPVAQQPRASADTAAPGAETSGTQPAALPPVPIPVPMPDPPAASEVPSEVPKETSRGQELIAAPPSSVESEQTDGRAAPDMTSNEAPEQDPLPVEGQSEAAGHVAPPRVVVVAEEVLSLLKLRDDGTLAAGLSGTLPTSSQSVTMDGQPTQGNVVEDSPVATALPPPENLLPSIDGPAETVVGSGFGSPTAQPEAAAAPETTVAGSYAAPAQEATVVSEPAMSVVDTQQPLAAEASAAAVEVPTDATEAQQESAAEAMAEAVAVPAAAVESEEPPTAERPASDARAGEVTQPQANLETQSRIPPSEIDVAPVAAAPVDAPPQIEQQPAVPIAAPSIATPPTMAERVSATATSERPPPPAVIDAAPLIVTGPAPAEEAEPVLLTEATSGPTHARATADGGAESQASDRADPKPPESDGFDDQGAQDDDDLFPMRGPRPASVAWGVPICLGVLFGLLALAGVRAQFPSDSDQIELLQQANSLVRDARPEDAIPVYEQIIATTPDFDLAYRHLGVAYALTGNNDLAREAYERYIKRARDREDSERVRRLLKREE